MRRVVLHSGKVHHDLRTEVEKTGRTDVALVRLEQLAPLPLEQILEVLAGYPDAEVVWAQEEPENQGAWPFLALNLPGDLAEHGETRPLRCVARVPSASPSAGTAKKHAVEQKDLIARAFDR